MHSKQHKDVNYVGAFLANLNFCSVEKLALIFSNVCELKMSYGKEKKYFSTSSVNGVVKASEKSLNPLRPKIVFLKEKNKKNPSKLLKYF